MTLKLPRGHNRVEGSTEYTQLLYIPSKAPHDILLVKQKRELSYM